MLFLYRQVKSKKAKQLAQGHRVVKGRATVHIRQPGSRVYVLFHTMNKLLPTSAPQLLPQSPRRMLCDQTGTHQAQGLTDMTSGHVFNLEQR